MAVQSPLKSNTVSIVFRNAAAIIVAAVAIGFLFANSGGDTRPLAVRNYHAKQSQAVTHPSTNADHGSARNSQRGIGGESHQRSESERHSSGSTSSDAAANSEQSQIPIRLEGIAGLRLNVALLERGLQRLLEIPSYTATMAKQERIGGDLSDSQVIRMKLRHAPFSVYMCWLEGDVGREALFVEGQNDGKTLFHFGGWKARMLPTLKLDPHGSLAQRESRYPITEAGILGLIENLIKYRQRDLSKFDKLHFEIVDGQVCHGRDCYFSILEYFNQDDSELYRKSISYIDKEWSVPVWIKNYTWPNFAVTAASDDSVLDGLTLIESYAFSDIEMNAPLSNKDFDAANDEYMFRGK